MSDKGSERRIVERDQIRETQTREASSRAVESTYTPPSRLPDPPPSDEWVYRYIRISTYGELNSNNAWQRRAEGWEFVAPSELPDISQTLGVPSNHTRIEVGGLALCKAPKSRMQAREKYYQNQASNQLKGVDAQLMRQSDPVMPILKPERTTRYS